MVNRYLLSQELFQSLKHDKLSGFEMVFRRKINFDFDYQLFVL